MNVHVSEQTMSNARSIAQDVHSLMIASYSFDGSSVKPMPAVTLRDTIAAKLVEPGDLLRVQLRYPDDGPDDRWRASCETLLGGGLEHRGKTHKILGASSSLKKGNVWLATDTVRDRLHPFFSSSQEALAYCGVLFSGCHHGVHHLEGVRGMVVEDGEQDTADGMGFVSHEFLRRMNLPKRQIQVRFVGDQPGAQWLGKGTCMPREMDKDFILPKSMIKGAGTPPDGLWTCWFGVRDIARTRRYRSSFTYAQWFDDETLEAVWPVAEHRLDVIKEALSDREAALRFLGLMHGDKLDPARSKCELFLEAGIEPDHPWLQRQLRQMMRRSFVDLALGGGIELEGRMGAWTPGLPEGVVCASDLPAGPAVLSRYPIRDPHSFIAVWNEPDAVADAPAGSIFVNEVDCGQLDGDYDGDQFTICTQPAVVDAVTSPDWFPEYRRQDVPSKQRRNDPIQILPAIAVESLGGAIGTFSYAIAGALHAGKQDRISCLSAALQSEVQSLKWSTRGDRNLLEDSALAIPQFIVDAKNDRDLFDRYAKPVEGESALVRQYNRVVAAWTHNLPTTRPLMHFKTSLPIWKEPRALDLVEEAAAVVQVFNRWIASILKKHPNPSQEELEGPLSFLRAWCQSKLEERRAWAVALWHVVHGSRADSTGSAAFHCFDKEMAELIAETARLPLPVCQVSASNDPVTSKQDSTDNLHTDQPRSMVTPGDSVVIPLVGGVHSHNNDVAAFREAVRSLSDLDDITISTRVRPEHGVGFFVEEMYLGSVPQDHMMFGSILEGLSFTARVNLRGRSIFMMPTSPSWFVAEPARN